MREAPGIPILSSSGGRIGDAAMRRFAGRFDDLASFDREPPPPAPPGCFY